MKRERGRENAEGRGRSDGTEVRPVGGEKRCWTQGEDRASGRGEGAEGTVGLLLGQGRGTSRWQSEDGARGSWKGRAGEGALEDQGVRGDKERTGSALGGVDSRFRGGRW
jgi:hypothetical protein